MQISRLFEMVYLLLDKKKVTAGQMAEHFGVSARTVYRDVEVLSQAGIPIYATKGAGGGHFSDRQLRFKQVGVDTAGKTEHFGVAKRHARR